MYFLIVITGIIWILFAVWGIKNILGKNSTNIVQKILIGLAALILFSAAMVYIFRTYSDRQFIVVGRRIEMATESRTIAASENFKTQKKEISSAKMNYFLILTNLQGTQMYSAEVSEKDYEKYKNEKLFVTSLSKVTYR